MKSCAIIAVHGILCHCGFFDFILRHVPSGVHVRRILLEGHGGTVRDFSAASMQGWRETVAAEVAELRKSYDRVLFAGHSMGTLFGIEEACKGTVDGLFLLDVPLYIHITRRLLDLQRKVYLDRIDPSDLNAMAAREAYSIAPDRNPAHYIGWIPRFVELLAEIHKVRPLAGRFTVPAKVYVSALDEVVSPRSARCFADNVHADVTVLPESGHFYYPPADSKRIEDGFKDMMKDIFS